MTLFERIYLWALLRRQVGEKHHVVFGPPLLVLGHLQPRCVLRGVNVVLGDLPVLFVFGVFRLAVAWELSSVDANVYATALLHILFDAGHVLLCHIPVGAGLSALPVLLSFRGGEIISSELLFELQSLLRCYVFLIRLRHARVILSNQVPLSNVEKVQLAPNFWCRNIIGGNLFQTSGMLACSEV
jgi:hypothetical protein